MKDKVIFLGDSLTEWGNWSDLIPEFTIINEGIAGNTTQDVLYRLPDIVWGGISKLFLMIGINDLGNQIPVPEILRNYNEITERLQQKFPETQVYLISVLPVKFGRLKVPGLTAENLKILNKGISEIAEMRDLVYINMASDFTDENNRLKTEYTIDGLHLSKEGYLKWKDTILDYLNK